MEATATADTFTRDEAIVLIRKSLRDRSGRAWSVTGGKGTAWGWITITAVPSRRTCYGGMNDIDRAALASMLGQEVHHQGVSIPARSDFRAEYVERAAGRTPSVVGVAYWD